MVGKETDFEALIRDCFQHPEDLDTLARFDQAFRPYLLAVLTAISRRDPALAEDAYQSAFIKFIDTFQTGRKPGTNYAPYFVALAKNSLIDELRRRRHHVPIDELVEEVNRRTPSDAEKSLEARVAVLQAMTRLSPRCQFLLESYYIAELPPQEIARQLKVRPASVHKLLHRCRDQFRKIFFQGGVRN